MPPNPPQSEEPAPPATPRYSRRPASWTRSTEPVPTPAPAPVPEGAANDLFVDEQTWAESYGAPSRLAPPTLPISADPNPMRLLALESTSTQASLGWVLVRYFIHAVGVPALLVASVVACYRLPIAVKFQYTAAIVSLFVITFLWFSWLRKHTLVIALLGLGAMAWLGLKTGPPYEWMEPVKPWLPSKVQALLPQASSASGTK